MSKKRTGSNTGARIALIAGLVAAAPGISALAAAPHLRGRTEGNGSQASLTESGTDVPDSSSSSGTDTSWTGESSDGLITYQGKRYRYNSHLSNYLLLGIDTKGDIMQERETLKGGQSDSIFLVSYDRKEETVRMLAIPRDTMTTVQLYDQAGGYVGTSKEQITLQYAYGDGKEKSCKLARDTVSNLLYGVPIIGYTAINLDSIPLLADTVGGVTLIVPDDSMEDVNPAFKKGEEITLTSETAESYLRHRDIHTHQQALVRMERQKSFINAFVDRVLELQREDPHTITDIYETLRPHMVTNMSNDIYLDLAGAKRVGAIETIPGEGVATQKYDEYHVDEDALYELILDVFYIEES